MTSRVDTARPGSRALIGNFAVGLVLALLALLLLRWQRSPLGWDDPGQARIIAAAGVTIAYFGACVAFFGSLRRRRRRAESADPSIAADPALEVGMLVAFASQTGYAEHLATQTARSLRDAGLGVELRALARVDADLLLRTRRALFVVSTTGEGDAPDGAARFVEQVMSSDLRLAHLHVGVLALGDTEYVNFCAFGQRIRDWLQRAQAHALFDLIEVDNGDPGALRHWQHHLGALAGKLDLPDWQVPDYARWRLVERRVLNPGSAGEPCFHLALRPLDGELPTWDAGDIAEIGPQNAPGVVNAWLADAGLDGDAGVDVEPANRRLRDVVARSTLPPVAEVRNLSTEALVARLRPLPHREYSIASTPADGRIDLLTRQMRRPDGTLGIGTGWLTEYAAIDGEIALRIRANSNFHAPDANVPLILIGNGTGLGALRALLKQRIAARRRRNWLVFGERNADRDYYYRDEIERWVADGDIERLDLAFSRDQPERMYVQHALDASADTLREWVDAGAVIQVCGSLEGMAPGVDATLRGILGDVAVTELTATARYRRDVY